MFLVAHMLVGHVPVSYVSWSFIRGSSTCIIIFHRYDDPTTAPTGDPSMARLPCGLQKHVFGMPVHPWSHAPYNLLIAVVVLLAVPKVIQTWHIFHQTLRSVQSAKLLLNITDIIVSLTFFLGVIAISLFFIDYHSMTK